MKNNEFIDKLKGLVLPAIKSKDFELYYLEYVKEGGQNIFRVYIDSENGVTLDNCVSVSRAISDILDIEDPISDEYNLEVSSPGVFRDLYTEAHYNKYIDYDVAVKLSSLLNGKKKYEGILRAFDEANMVVEVDKEEVIIPREKIFMVSLNPTL